MCDIHICQKSTPNTCLLDNVQLLHGWNWYEGWRMVWVWSRLSSLEERNPNIPKACKAWRACMGPRGIACIAHTSGREKWHHPHNFASMTQLPPLPRPITLYMCVDSGNVFCGVQMSKGFPTKEVENRVMWGDGPLMRGKGHFMHVMTNLGACPSSSHGFVSFHTLVSTTLGLVIVYACIPMQP